MSDDPKKALREAMLTARNSLSKQILEEMSEVIQARVLRMDKFINAKTVGAYHPLGSEVSTLKILASTLQMGKRLALPRVKDEKKMVFAEVGNIENDLEVGRYGVMEPKDHCAEMANLELLLLPGVAWDEAGHRLGYGKGYYDAYLANARTYTRSIGLAYDSQVLEKIPYGSSDLRVDLIVTETRTIIVKESN